MKIQIIIIILFFISLTSGFAQEVIDVGGGGFPYGNKKGFIYGKLEDAETGEEIIGAIIKDLGSDNVTVSDINGDFRLRVPIGLNKIEVQSVGYKKQQFSLNVAGEGVYLIALESDTKELDAVIVSGEKLDANIASTNVGQNSLSVESIRQLPMAMGEIDIIKSLSLLPGISTSSELSTGFNVRGGGSDQNLILLGDVPIYNPAHLFGFYTSFNSEMVDDVALYKGAVPAQYGGRASSVLHVKYRDGDYRKWKANISAGVVSSKVMVEGPLIKDKASILVSGRKSYVNWMLGYFDNADVNQSSADFYDINAIVNYKLNDKNKLTYSLYKSSDDFNLAGDTLYQWSNFYQAINWYHSFSPSLNLKLTGALSEYDNMIENQQIVNPFQLKSKIENQIVNGDLEYIYSEKLLFHTGFNFTTTSLSPGERIPLDLVNGTLDYRKTDEEQSRELAVYLDGSYDLTKKLKVSGGLRYNTYSYLGDHQVFVYEQYKPRSRQNTIDSVSYGSGENIQNYSGFEPRFSMRYSLNNDNSVKWAYTRMYQYISLISNTNSISPSDIWKLSDNYIKPQIAEQISLGYYQNFRNNQFETSIEGFYKEIDNVLDYKDGAQLFLNNNIETELLSGRGRSYGLELFLKKKAGGRATGWVSYTLSRSERQVQGAYEIETINNGEWYQANFDRTHNLTGVLIYKLPKNWEFSSTFNFKSGQPITYPAGKLNLGADELAFYADRNSERAPVFHRLDISFTKKFNFLKNKKGEFNFSVYNLYGRKNAMSVFFQDVPGSPPQPYQLAVLGLPFPSLTFTFKI